MKAEKNAKALFSAIDRQDEKAVSILVKAFPALLTHAVNKNNLKPASYAASIGWWSGIQRMGENAGYLPDDQAQFGFGLLLALRAKQFDLARTLLIRHENINSNYYSPNDGNFSLHIAVQYGAPRDVIALLIKRDADLTKENQDKQTPIQYAAKNGWWEGVRRIADNAKNLTDDQANFGPALLYALIAGKFDEARSLLLNNININANRAFSNAENYPLHIAIQKNAPLDIIKLMLYRGANPNFKNKAGQTPADLAVQLGRHSALEVLTNEAFYNAGLKEFITLASLGHPLISQLPKELMPNIALQLGHDIDSYTQICKLTDPEVNQIKQDALAQKNSSKHLSTYPFITSKSSPVASFVIDKLKEIAESCTNDKNKSVYVHRLLDQHDDTTEGMTAALSLLESMHEFYPKSEFSRSYILSTKHDREQAHRNCMNQLNTSLSPLEGDWVHMETETETPMSTETETATPDFDATPLSSSHLTIWVGPETRATPVYPAVNPGPQAPANNESALSNTIQKIDSLMQRNDAIMQRNDAIMQQISEARQGNNALRQRIGAIIAPADPLPDVNKSEDKQVSPRYG